MKVVIPLAGYGKRLRPHTFTKPKPLVNVAGKPVLGHVLDMFQTLEGVDEIIFIVGHLGEQIEAYVAQNYPHIKASYFEQKELNGQSTAIYLARERLSGSCGRRPGCNAPIRCGFQFSVRLTPKRQNSGDVSAIIEVMKTWYVRTDADARAISSLTSHHCIGMPK